MNKLSGISVSALLFALFAASGALSEPPLGIQGDVTVQNDATKPVPVEIVNGVVPVSVVAGEHVTLTGSGFFECTFGPNSDECPSFVSASIAIPEGKELIVETVSVFWEVGEGDVVPAIAAVQGLSPFQRHVVGPTLTTPGFTGAEAGASATLSFAVTGGVTGVVGFHPDRPSGTGVAADLFVAGRLVDAPAE